MATMWNGGDSVDVLRDIKHEARCNKSLTFHGSRDGTITLPTLPYW